VAPGICGWGARSSIRDTYTDRGPAVDPANPRAQNAYGHIIRWREQEGNPAATAFEWDIFVLCGDPANSVEAKRGTIKGDLFGSPDGLWFDDRGVLWIQTDVSTSALNKGDYANIGNNQMLAADPATGDIRRFLAGPNGCEVTGVITTPDGRTMFVNIQHPGEPPSERADPANPTAVSAWPNNGARPRAATVVIRRRDGGAIGS
jgi:secreted PhoX family phosphatase